MWLGGCGNTPTDLAKHVAKIVPEKAPKLNAKTDSDLTRPHLKKVAFWFREIPGYFREI